ncbi:MAG TPA: peptidase dimerization domain-containing protein, partial [Trueperaceae bacterium]|nr:peptidase dimerization domain-containing protein [Trueperaceae bacterium]
VDAIVAMRDAEWPSDPDLGTTYYTIGVIKGGVAPNVVPPSAEAEALFRTVGDHAIVRERLAHVLSGRVEIEDVLTVPPVRLRTVPDFDTAVFNFTTDVPFLDKWGTPLLMGPGSINVAHTSEEHLEIAEMHRAVDLYASLAKTLLER